MSAVPPNVNPPAPPKTPLKTLPLPPRPQTALPKPGTKPAKVFSVRAWADDAAVEKIVIYGRSGIGKTSLAATAPNPVFIGIDDGGRRLVHPGTGEKLQHVDGIETFSDLRDALNQDSLWTPGGTLALDTLTKVEPLIQAHVLETVSVNGQRLTSFRKYGWDGDRYFLDCGRLLLTDLDRQARRGVHVVLLCQQGQIRVANAEGADYLEDGPALPHRNDCSFREEVKQWADHVLRISYLTLDVNVEKGAKAGKVVTSDDTRAIFTAGAQHFTAKTRPVHGRRLDPVISFASEADDSLWQFMFPNR